MKALLSRILGGPGTTRVDEFEVFEGGNPAALNILIFTEHLNATYYISFDIPLRRLHARGEVNFAVVSQSKVKTSGVGCWERWAGIFRPNVVVLTRYSLPYGPNILDFFHREEVPVIYHIDDNLLEIPASLGAEIRQRQGADDVVAARRHLLGNCDLIYASTDYLAALLKRSFPTQQVFHGIYAPYMGDEIQTARHPGQGYPVVGYMGSKGHQQDLELVVPTIERLLDERVELEFEVFGTVKMPLQLERFGRRARSHSVQKSYVAFLARLSELNWTVGLAPLVDAPFNRCKAPTKFIEYSACGIPVIASDSLPYSNVIPKDGGVLVKHDWHLPISEYLDQPDFRKRATENARNYCLSAFPIQALMDQLTHMFRRFA
jgi:glycosyltransferase involved in cell wall biosynthesis